MPPHAALLDTAAGFSRYAARLLARAPDLVPSGSLAAPYARERMETELGAAAPADEAALKRALRQLRARVMLHVMARDLAGLAPLGEVVSTVTALAEVAIEFGLELVDSWTARQFGEPLDANGRRQRLIVVGMGKLGGGELNVSSDIDLIFVYPEDGETTGERSVSVHEYFTRVGRRLINALSDPTEDGFVFRVDMRLRPYGESGPLVVSLDMLEEYFTVHGRAWERYAWVKARALTGDRSAELDALAMPFVYRRHLDFSAIQSMRELHDQIAAEVRRRDITDNIKLGRGGIREVEFTVQVFQLIRGGREPGLRVRPTLDALRAVVERGLLPAGAQTELGEAYAFLRTLEHRLQYLDDAQTQELPVDPADRDRLAASLGFRDFDALLTRLDTHRTVVAGHFEAIFAGPAPASRDPLADALRPGADDAAGLDILEDLGFERPPEVLAKVRTLSGSSRFQQMSASARGRLDDLLPRLVRSAARHSPASSTLDRLLDIVESIGRRESYLALLVEYPQALDAVARLVSLSGWACDYLARHPMLLDELIDPRQLVEPDWPRLDAELATALAHEAGNAEGQMDLLRQFRHIQTFRLLALDLAGVLTLERLSDHLSDLACLLLRHCLRLTWERLPSRHRDDPLFAVIAYGKLGGKELGYESDLDIIFLFDDEAPGASENYARLAQRMNGMLNSYTGAGILYETDLRLRPDGASGLLVRRLEAFAEYQRRSAWTWEHQALTRARYVAGDATLGAAFETLRVEILRKPRELDALREEVREMRRRMRDGHPNTSELFDIKHDPGGIVDVEFVVQFLVLAHASRHAALTGNIGNIGLLHLAQSLELVAAPLGARAADAYRIFRRQQHALRLRGDRYARVPPEALARERSAVAALWDSVLGASRADRLPSSGNT
ncbi:MAG: bifunctional [glutamate--ammonia ligase]-adenylyl-L-tyrosine phosphorylase/[glutamate--ammonia-ligase] adenylyltransferase [Betaproteobacteria bacterium]|nr:bifunctional [glutamate--ammonia ligase]-adenylyl-L-tyrosine phosphorylase/[glutamate--ammonia-ligase] adenylyltransferase [Betaproteobacteria bacterium]